MEIEGRIFKSKDCWLAEVPSLDIMTQGESKDEALLMLKDAILALILSYFKKEVSKDFDVNVNLYNKGVIGITTTDNKLMLALSLRRQREISGSTVREVAERLGSKSPHAYAQYEKGKVNISLDKYEKLLYAANPSQHRQLRIV
ncbi:type II toxin-antitoxin system HicB family antitoxin [Candidatus Protochlamydia phocaeensis]|uniref:type II toxin-antitoxin system HicB family antitoxin n=1 Tax=Candidatus Protochlamydia phocaeensis TaxID=1414722 RepID=UPI00083842D2|nr:type II toxin-antitoxin system HicB family antitoxin [Candidatus Protochlamydia phocaeensis]